MIIRTRLRCIWFAFAVPCDFILFKSWCLFVIFVAKSSFGRYRIAKLFDWLVKNFKTISTRWCPELKRSQARNINLKTHLRKLKIADHQEPKFSPRMKSYKNQKLPYSVQTWSQYPRQLTENFSPLKLITIVIFGLEYLVLRNNPASIFEGSDTVVIEVVVEVSVGDTSSHW